MLIMDCSNQIRQINAEIARKAVHVYRQPQGVVPHHDGIEDSFWDDNLFNPYNRIRKHEFASCIQCNYLWKCILCGRKNKAQYFLSDIYMMVLIGFLSFRNSRRFFNELGGSSSSNHEFRRQLQRRFKKEVTLDVFAASEPDSELRAAMNGGLGAAKAADGIGCS